MNLMTLLNNITAHLSRLNATASIHSLTQQLKKLFGILNTTTGKLTTPTQKNSCKLRKFGTYRRQPLLTQSLLILSSFVLITSCAPSSDTAAPPDNPTLLANLIKESNLSTISGLTVTADNSDPANPKLTITGITNNSNTAPVTAEINIDQNKGITTDPASFTVTADSPISPYSTNTALTVTFEGEAAVSYTVTTQISGAAVKDWIVNENLSEYITVSFGGQSGNLSVADTALSITGLTNSPGADAGTITFGNLPAGFTAEPSSITLPNPDGTESATITADPNTFTITEEGNTGNSETYTIGTIDLAKLTRFTPSIHIKVAEGGTDITSSLTITEENNNTIRIAGLRNKLGDNQYTLTIDEVPDFFTIPGVAIRIERTIVEPTEDFLPAPASSITPFRTIQVLNSGESNPTDYTLIVDFSAAAPSDWFTMTSFNTYITGGSYNGETAALAFDGTTLALSGGDDFTNVPNGEVALTIGTLLDGYTLTTNLMDPDGDGLAAVTDGNAGMITIVETANTNNKQDYPVTITLGAYRSPLTADNITAMYGGATPDEKTTASSSDITIDTNMITISGFINKASTSSESGTVTVTAPDGYTITPTDLTISDPTGDNSTNTNIGTITVTNTNTMNAVPHPVTVSFFGTIQLSITGNDVMDETEVNSGGTISITTAACQLLTPPTVSVVGNDNSKVAETTPFPLYYDRGRDPSDTNGFSVTRKLTLVDSTDESMILGRGFQITLEHFPACDSFAGSGDGTSGTPYEIDNAPRLQYASHLVNNSNGIMPTGSTNTYGESHYKITAAINMGLPGFPLSEVGSKTPDGNDELGKGFDPIGITNSISLLGGFDCASNTISGLYINRPDEANIGLIGYIGNGTTVNRTVQNCAMTDVNITGKSTVGGLVGFALTNVMISNSYVTGTVSAPVTSSTGTANNNIGGLVGILDKSTVTSSYAAVMVSGEVNVGGLVGSINNDPASINNSYAAGTVSANSNAGGLVGNNDGFLGSFTISNSYSAATVSIVSSTNTSIGGLVGVDAVSGIPVTNSYWDITIGPPVRTKEYGTGRTTTQMQVSGPVTDAPVAGEVDNRVYVNWDKDSMGMVLSSADQIWNFTDGQYPRLIKVPCANRQYNQDATECTSPLQ